MKLHLIFRRPAGRNGLTGADEHRVVVVRYAHPIHGWLQYDTQDGMTHWVPESALWESYIEEEPGDPDPMRGK